MQPIMLNLVSYTGTYRCTTGTFCSFHYKYLLSATHPGAGPPENKQKSDLLLVQNSFTKVSKYYFSLFYASLVLNGQFCMSDSFTPKLMQ